MVGVEQAMSHWNVSSITTRSYWSQLMELSQKGKDKKYFKNFSLHSHGIHNSNLAIVSLLLLFACCPTSKLSELNISVFRLSGLFAGTEEVC